MSLLKITTTPIEYEIKVERAKLRTKSNDPQSIEDYQETARQIRGQSRVNRAVTPQNVARLDESTQKTESFQNAARMRTAGKPVATETSNLVTDKIANASETAMQTAGVEASADKQVNFSSGLTDDTEFIIDEDMFVNSYDLSGMTSTLPQEWTVTKNDMEFVPGRFQMDIVQLPKVSIEYTGGFQYVPASADPNYEKP